MGGKLVFGAVQAFEPAVAFFFGDNAALFNGFAFAADPHLVM